MLGGGGGIYHPPPTVFALFSRQGQVMVFGFFNISGSNVLFSVPYSDPDCELLSIGSFKYLKIIRKISLTHKQ